MCRTRALVQSLLDWEENRLICRSEMNQAVYGVGFGTISCSDCKGTYIAPALTRSPVKMRDCRSDREIGAAISSGEAHQADGVPKVLLWTKVTTRYDHGS